MIPEDSNCTDKTIAESQIRNKFNLLILGVKPEPDDKIEFSPLSSYVLKPGMTLIVTGEVDRIAEAQKFL